MAEQGSVLKQFSTWRRVCSRGTGASRTLATVRPALGWVSGQKRVRWFARATLPCSQSSAGSRGSHPVPPHSSRSSPRSLVSPGGTRRSRTLPLFSCDSPPVPAGSSRGPRRRAACRPYHRRRPSGPSGAAGRTVLSALGACVRAPVPGTSSWWWAQPCRLVWRARPPLVCEGVWWGEWGLENKQVYRCCPFETTKFGVLKWLNKVDIHI